MDTAGGDAMGAGVETGAAGGGRLRDIGGGNGGGRLRESDRGRAERRASEADRRRGKHGPKPPHAAYILRWPIGR
jgi:hypothetical protein